MTSGEIPRGNFGVILADPPWRFRTFSPRGRRRGAVRHYPTMKPEEIRALPVASAAADDCALFLWGTWPNLREALDLIEVWGFKYSGCAFDWLKLWPKRAPKWPPPDHDLAMGLGYGTRANTEFCLLGRRGAPRRKSGGVRQVMIGEPLVSPRRGHSEKPDEQYARIEALYDGPYLELFARSAWPGWASWGNHFL